LPAANNLSYRSGVLVSTGFALLSRTLTIISGIILAKVFEPEVFGRFFSDQALVLIGGGLINLGVGQGYRLLVSREPELRISHLLPTIAVRFFATLLYFVGLTVFLNYTGLWRVQTVVVVVGTLLLSFLELFQIDLQITRSFLGAAILELGKGLVVFLAVVICYLAGNNKYDIFVISYLIFSFLLIAFGWATIRPAISSLLRFNYIRLLKISIPFAAALFAYAFTSFWGLIYIREVLGEEQAGFYAVPLKVYQISLVVGMSVTAVTLPLYHKLAASGQFKLYAEVFGRLIRGLWFISGIIVAVCCFIPEFLIRVFANEQYLPAASIFPWVGFGIMFRLLAIPAGNILESVDKQWYRVAIQAIGAIICVSGVSFIVPHWGIIGAAWTLFAVDLWILAAYWFTSKHFAPTVVSLRKLFLPAGVLLSGFAILSTFLDISGWLKLMILCLLWAGYVTLYLNFKEELRNLSKTLLKRA